VHVRRRGPIADVRIFDENEESTKIAQATYLTFSPVKAYIIVPILSLCTALIFLLVLHWYPRVRKNFLYSECPSVYRATHIFIVGTCK
jgi:hypothetical protein